jgi:hypothetical protein
MNLNYFSTCLNNGFMLDFGDHNHLLYWKNARIMKVMGSPSIPITFIIWNPFPLCHGRRPKVCCLPGRKGLLRMWGCEIIRLASGRIIASSCGYQEASCPKKY